MSLGDITMEE